MLGTGLLLCFIAQFNKYKNNFIPKKGSLLLLRHVAGCEAMLLAMTFENCLFTNHMIVHQIVPISVISLIATYQELA